jgi:hypothetical protein
MTDSRSKGRRGEVEAAALLTERGYTVLPTPPGKATCDLVTVDERGTLTAWEVKHRKLVDLARFRDQARRQAADIGPRCRWGLLVRLDGHAATFLVERQGERPALWRGRSGERERV